jgi:ankyrin repeat protein
MVQSGKLPVHIAASQGNVEAVKCLLNRGATASATSGVSG